MKKFVALLLAMLLVLANVAALAEGLDDLIENVEQVQQNQVVTLAAAPSYKFYKKYTTDVDGLFPNGETLKFTPDTTNAAKINIADYTVNTANALTIDERGKYVRVTPDQLKSLNSIYYEIPFTIASAATYTRTGKFTSTFTENTGSAQGVTYGTTTQFTVDVYVTRNRATGDLEIGGVNIYTGPKGEDGKKPSEVTNEFKTVPTDDDWEGFYVQKKITGDYGNVKKEFTIEIELTADKPVYTDITVRLDNATAKIGSDPISNNKIPAGTSGWTSKTITLTAANEGKITFINIPKGLKYTVKEKGVNRIGTKPAWEAESIIEYSSQDEAINDENAYAVDGEISEATEITTNAKAIITNDKSITIPPTGITLETAPYVLMMVIAIAGIVLLINRKRIEEV